MGKVITLKHPIQQGSQTITELTFERRLKAKDFKGLPTSLGFDEMFLLIGRLSAQPPSVIDELDTEDLMSCMEVVKGFLPGGLPAGSSGSAS
ncbi:phage tail assembly protein [Desulfocurvibacter africanus]|uniref:phage tail assembly protein n=1 Tax=Desulfocurvibacter africanus TaxID=873 RepID=UPI0003F7D2B5|nr:phage tail assembly protein [Desulfocurvibacter africanus]